MKRRRIYRIGIEWQRDPLTVTFYFGRKSWTWGSGASGPG